MDIIKYIILKGRLVGKGLTLNEIMKYIDILKCILMRFNGISPFSDCYYWISTILGWKGNHSS